MFLVQILLGLLKQQHTKVDLVVSFIKPNGDVSRKGSITPKYVTKAKSIDSKVVGNWLKL